MYRTALTRLQREKAADALDFLSFTRLAIASCLDNDSLASYNEVKKSLKNEAGGEKPQERHEVLKGLAGRLQKLGAKNKT